MIIIIRVLEKKKFGWEIFVLFISLSHSLIHHRLSQITPKQLTSPVIGVTQLR